MGNKQHNGIIHHHHIELERPDGIYSSNDIVSGSVSHIKQANASVVLTGVIYFEKHKQKHREICKITFFSTEFQCISPCVTKQNFQLQLGDCLPPSFNNLNTFPNIYYSINLVYGKSENRIHSSVPIRVCPFIQIDQPLLLTPLFFGPVENHKSGLKIEVKLNRAVFIFDDIVQIFYELQNQSEEYIHKVQVSLGVYYLAESNIWQEDICNGIENLKNISSKNKLIRNKVLLNIPNKIYLPPTFQFKYGREGEPSSFNLTIDYKVQFKIYLGNSENLWQVDVPIVLCNSLLGQSDTASQSCFEQTNINTDFASQSSETNNNITE